MQFYNGGWYVYFLHDSGEDITKPRLEPEMEMVDIREGQTLDCNMVTEPSTTSEIG